MIWIVEDVFAGDTLPEAAARAGHTVVPFGDDDAERPLHPRPGIVLFRGSLELADRIARTSPWTPGAFCDTAALACSCWYPRALPWLAQRDVTFTTVRALCDAPPDADRFVRPDSPLKPFSGRVVRAGSFTPASLDHGFYYDDLDLPVVTSAVRALGEEARFVVVDRVVVAGSRYVADGRQSSPEPTGSAFWSTASRIAAALAAPESVYVLDLVETPTGIELLELNPFSGADLYGCDRDVVVTAIADHCAR